MSPTKSKGKETRLFSLKSAKPFCYKLPGKTLCRMEISKADDLSTEQAANLLGSPGRDNQMRQSGQVHKKRSKNRMVIVAVSGITVTFRAG